MIAAFTLVIDARSQISDGKVNHERTASPQPVLNDSRHAVVGGSVPKYVESSGEIEQIVRSDGEGQMGRIPSGCLNAQPVVSVENEVANRRSGDRLYP